MTEIERLRELLAKGAGVSDERLAAMESLCHDWMSHHPDGLITEDYPRHAHGFSRSDALDLIAEVRRWRTALASLPAVLEAAEIHWQRCIRDPLLARLEATP